MTETQALDLMASILRRDSWDADTIDDLAHVVTATGRDIAPQLELWDPAE